MQYIFEIISHAIDNNYENLEIAYLLENDFLIASSKYSFEKGYQQGKDFAYQELNAIIKEIKDILRKNISYTSKNYFKDIYQEAVEKYLIDGYKKYCKHLNEFDEEEENKNAEILAAIHFELNLKFNYTEEEIKTIKKNDKFNWIRNEDIHAYSKGYLEGSKRIRIKYLEENKITIEEYKNRLLSKPKDLQLKLVELARTNSLLTKSEKPQDGKAVNYQTNESKLQITCTFSEQIINDFQTFKNEFKLQFRDEQKQLLKQYYDMNRLLVYCLKSAVNQVCSHIEDTLFLPIDEIREIEKGKGIK